VSSPATAIANRDIPASVWLSFFIVEDSSLRL
jgi:hypothetical protein